MPKLLVEEFFHQAQPYDIYSLQGPHRDNPLVCASQFTGDEICSTLGRVIGLDPAERVSGEVPLYLLDRLDLKHLLSR